MRWPGTQAPQGRRAPLQKLREALQSNDQQGITKAAEGLQASAKGSRVRFSGSKRTVVDGPFAETKELVAGFWLIQAKSKEEAIEWVKRVPFEEGEVEVRQVFETDDFGPALTPELRDAEERLRAQTAGRK